MDVTCSFLALKKTDASGMQLHLKAITPKVLNMSSLVPEGMPGGVRAVPIYMITHTADNSWKKIISILIILQGREAERLGRNYSKPNQQVSCKRVKVGVWTTTIKLFMVTEIRLVWNVVPTILNPKSCILKILAIKWLEDS